MARLKTIIDAERAAMADQNVVVLDAGDPFQGSLFYTTYKGAAEAEFMEAIGYDAWPLETMNLTMVPKGWPILSMQFHSPLSAGIWIYQQKLVKRSCKRSRCFGNRRSKIGIVSALAVDTVDTSSPGEMLFSWMRLKH